MDVVSAKNKDNVDFEQLSHIHEFVQLGGTNNIARKIWGGVYKSTINAALNKKKSARIKLFDLPAPPREGAGGWMSDSLMGEISSNVLIHLYMKLTKNVLLDRAPTGAELQDVCAVYNILYGHDEGCAVTMNHVYNAMKFAIRFLMPDEDSDIKDESSLYLYSCLCGSSYFAYSAGGMGRRSCPWCRNSVKNGTTKKDKITPSAQVDSQVFVNLDRFLNTDLAPPNDDLML